MIAEVPKSLLLGGWMLGEVSVVNEFLINEGPKVLLLVVPLCILIYVAIAVRRRLRRKASQFGYGGILEYLRAVPKNDAEKRDAVNLAMHGVVDCLLGVAFFPLLLIGIFPLYYGVRKVMLIALGVGPDTPPAGP
jgi:hypothetical protein